MFTSTTATPERKPGVANWFSSLRRQPKNKKPIGGKSMQKSCVDLSILAPTATTAASDSNTTIVKSSRSNGATENNSFIAQSSNVWTSQPPAGTDCQCPTVISKTETLQIDRVKKTTADGSKNRARSETRTTNLMTTTTTKVVQTTVITKQSHRVGLVFNDDGELISKLETFKNFANNINNQLVGVNNGGLISSSGRLTNNNNSHSSSVNSNISGSSSSGGGGSGSITSSGLLPLDDDIEYIDGSDMKNREIISNNKPKPCAMCRNKFKTKTKSDWNINGSGKVYIFHLYNRMIGISTLHITKPDIIIETAERNTNL